MLNALDRRQLWNFPTKTTAHPSETGHCTPIILPSNGILSFADTTISLTANVVFKPECTGNSISDVTAIAGKDPFYASTIPQTFVIAATTVIAWILVIMLIITPRTNFLGQSGGVAGFSSGHGIIGGATGGNTNLIGVGTRPWLQKVAALTVAISLTIATADTLRCAKEQYNGGYMDATVLRDDVLGSLEIRITRVISDVFLWLAQVQTLIRLFPRHKEKVLIKWIGFALILLDSLFSCLNSFGFKHTRTHSPREFVDAIPALSYLFELALGLLYAAWVIYYSVSKRRYAFYHAKMPSISLIALLSLIAILTPVVFFVTDVSNQDVAGWGEYFRWVGAAAASVIVWEWVERIEALERDEKKDGILGREIFDGDEMLDVNPSEEVMYTPSRYGGGSRYRRDGSESGTQSSSLEKGLSSIAVGFRKRTQKVQRRFPFGHRQAQNAEDTFNVSSDAPNANRGVAFGTLPKPHNQQAEPVPTGITPPPLVASPVSRADTTSAASTVYIIRQQSDSPAGGVPRPVRRQTDRSDTREVEKEVPTSHPQNSGSDPEKEEAQDTVAEDIRPNRNRTNNVNWLSVANPFKRKRSSPPAEVQQARRNSMPGDANKTTEARATTPANNLMGMIAGRNKVKWRDRRDGKKLEERPLGVTIVPAQPRGVGRGAAVQSQESSPSGGSGSAERSTGQPETGSTTLTANSFSASNSNAARLPSTRPDTNSPPMMAGGRSPGTTPDPHRSSSLTPEALNRGTPPRADEIVPASDRNSPTIIPAPNRRSMRSPVTLETHHEVTSNPRDGGEEGEG